MAGLRANIHLNLYVIQFYVVVVHHLDKQNIKAPGLFVGRCDMTTWGATGHVMSLIWVWRGVIYTTQKVKDVKYP